MTAESKLLERLTPADLRDPRLIVQAYMLYAAVLLGVYAALTFYGRIILDWVNNVLPTAGYTDTSKFDFSSPQWPLMVALAMIGVLPVLPPVEAVEVRLRHWTHRAVGIPLTIYRHSEAMRSQLRQTQRREARRASRLRQGHPAPGSRTSPIATASTMPSRRRPTSIGSSAGR